MSSTRTGEDTFLRGILESLETGLVVVDGSGTIVFSNDAAGWLVGRSPERLSDRALEELLVDADGRRLPIRIEVGTTDHDGEQHYTLSLTEPPRQAGSRTSDRTGDLLRGVFEESNDGLLVIDPTADRVLDCNGRACDLLGSKREDLLTRRPAELFSHDPESLLEFAETGRRVTGGARLLYGLRRASHGKNHALALFGRWAPSRTGPPPGCYRASRARGTAAPSIRGDRRRVGRYRDPRRESGVRLRQPGARGGLRLRLGLGSRR